MLLSYDRQTADTPVKGKKPMAKIQQSQPPEDNRFDHEEELSTFLPYWEADVGKSIDVRIVGVDQRDPAFVRYVFESIQNAPISCCKGSKEEQTPVLVQKGEQFTSSRYAGLSGLHEYIGLECRLRVKGTRKTGQASPMFVFSIGTTPETRAELQRRRLASAATGMNKKQLPKNGGGSSEGDLPF
jgi:hypothetical protein